MEAEALTSLLASMKSIFTFLTGCVGEVFTIMNQYPVAYLGIGAGLAFTAVRLVRSLMGR